MTMASPWLHTRRSRLTRSVMPRHPNFSHASGPPTERCCVRVLLDYGREVSGLVVTRTNLLGDDASKRLTLVRFGDALVRRLSNVTMVNELRFKERRSKKFSHTLEWDRHVTAVSKSARARERKHIDSKREGGFRRIYGPDAV